MNQYNHILVATDLSKSAEQTLKQSVDFAEKFGAKITLIHVVEQLNGYGNIAVPNLEVELLDQAREGMKSIGADFNIPESDQIIKIGSTKWEILDAAKSLGVDLIIMGSHGHHGVMQLLGSTASGVLHGAEIDVLVLRTK